MRAATLGAVTLALALLSPLACARAQNWHGQPGYDSGGQHWQHANRQTGYRHGDHHQRGGDWHRNHWRHVQWRHGPWGRPGYYRPHPPRPRYQSWQYAPPVVYAPPPPAPGIGFFFSFR